MPIKVCRQKVFRVSELTGSGCSIVFWCLCRCAVVGFGAFVVAVLY